MVRKEISRSFIFLSFFFFLNICLLSQTTFPIRPLVDTSRPPSWTCGYTLILLHDSDVLSVNKAKDFITAEGGRIAILSSAHAMLGWVAPELAEKLVGQHGIEEIVYQPVDLETLKYRDRITLSLVKSFNSVASGEVDSRNRTLRFQGAPLQNAAHEHPYADPQAVLQNLEDKHINWDAELKNIENNQGVFTGYSDNMLGTVAVCLFFVESDGSIDGNLYSWTTSAQDELMNACDEGCSFWAYEAWLHNQSLTFDIYYYDSSLGQLHQSYEPILHKHSDDALWINPIMANFGYTSGTKIDRVTAFNAWFKAWAQADYAFSCFCAYNPPGAATTFTDGWQGYAYYGGPYAHMLYRNNGWSLADNWSVFAHITGYIFWACGEWYQSGSGCTSCNSCNTFRPITNGNCEHPSCNANSVPCIMKDNSDAVCAYTALAVGWPGVLLTTQAGTGGTTNPTPGTNYYNRNSTARITATANAKYRFLDWSGDTSGTSNPIDVRMDRDKSVTANFMRRYDLTIQAGTGGTTDPAAGIVAYDKDSTARVYANADANYRFLNWTGDASGTTSPADTVMDRDKTIKANFLRQYNLVITSGEGGTTTPIPGTYKYDAGTALQASATAADFYVFSGWTGTTSGTSNPLSLTLNQDYSITANFRLIEPPSNFTGEQILNRSLIQFEYINVLKWADNANNSGLNISKYRIYRILDASGKTLVDEVDATVFRYLHRNVPKSSDFTYEIVSVLDNGKEGRPARITIQ